MFLENFTEELLILGNEQQKHPKQVRVRTGLDDPIKRTREMYRGVKEQHSTNTVRGWVGE